MYYNGTRNLKRFLPRYSGIKRFILLSIAVILLVSSTSVLFMPQAGAVTKASSAEASGSTWQIRSLLYYRTLANCFYNNTLYQTPSAFNLPPSNGVFAWIDQEDAINGRWFNSTLPKTPGIGYYMGDTTNSDLIGASDDGKTSCDNASLTLEAATHWGIDDPLELLCNSGFRRVGMGENQKPEECMAATSFPLEYSSFPGPTASGDAFRAYIKGEVYGDTSKEPALTSPEWYLFYRHSLAMSCIKEIDSIAPETSDPPDSSNPYGYTGVKWVDLVAFAADKNLAPEDGIITGYYIGQKPKSDNINLRLKGAADGFVDYSENCKDTVVLMNGYATDFALWAKANPTSTELLIKEYLDDIDEAGSSCVIEGVGWMLCPVFNFLAGVNDATYKIIEEMLVTDTRVVETDSDTYRAWAAMRTLANVGFVVVFLIIIFSQLTGAGVSNYGIKKLLPRIIITAILVNVSFVITQLAVDLSNILGGSLKTLFETIPTANGELANNLLATGNEFTDVTAKIFGGIGIIQAAAVAGVAAYYGGAGLLIPILLAAVLAIFLTLFILIARQAIIILLIVLAPLAFLAMLLPNTENLFKQWRKIFVALLLVYPMIAVLFGASHLASKILITVFATDDPNNVFGLLIGLAVMVLPLFLVPKLLQGSLNAVPFVGGLASKAAARSNGLLGRQAKQGATRSTFGRALGIRRQAKENYRAQKFAEGVSKKGSVANFLAKEVPILPSQRAANKAVDRTAIEAANKADAGEVAAAESLLRAQHANPSDLITAAGVEFKDAVANNDSVRARAAQSILLGGGGKGIAELESAVERSFPDQASKNSPVGQSVRAALSGAGLKGKNNVLGNWAYNTKSFDTTKQDSSVYADLSDAELGAHSLKNIQQAWSLGALSAERAEQIMKNDGIRGNMGNAEREFMKTVAENRQQGPTGPPPTP
jgi:hypothetical protein